MAAEADGAMAARLDALESRIAIADLVHAYARCVRHGDGAGCAALFVAEGSFETREGLPGQADASLVSRREGAASIGDYVDEQAARGLRLVPLIHNLMIALDGDRATSGAVLETRMVGSAQRVIGEYADRFVRHAGGAWRFEARVFTRYPDGG